MCLIETLTKSINPNIKNLFDSAFIKGDEMNDKIKTLIDKAVVGIIKRASSRAKIEHLQEKHNIKIHFVPRRYRILVGFYKA
ncbi:MAG: hypothetical protein LE179_02515 [Endomicrobium sp.]|nr:hypothetical protein [Endomicrobium sp.]